MHNVVHRIPDLPFFGICPLPPPLPLPSPITPISTKFCAPISLHSPPCSLQHNLLSSMYPTVSQSPPPRGYPIVSQMFFFVYLMLIGYTLAESLLHAPLHRGRVARLYGCWSPEGHPLPPSGEPIECPSVQLCLLGVSCPPPPPALTVSQTLMLPHTSCLLMVPQVVMIGTVVYGKYVRDIRKTFQEELGKAASVAEEMLGSMRTVRAFSREEAVQKHYERSIHKTFSLGGKLALASGIFLGGVGFLPQVAIALVVWYGGSLVISGAMTVGILTSFMLYTITVLTNGCVHIDGSMCVGGGARCRLVLENVSGRRFPPPPSSAIPPPFPLLIRLKMGPEPV